MHRRMLEWVRDLENLDPAAFSEANRRLHFELYSRCPNARLFGLVEAEWDRLVSTRRSSFAFVPGRVAESVAEHGRLLAALAGNDDPGRIEELVRDHRMAAAATLRKSVVGRSNVAIEGTCEPLGK